MLSQIRAMPGGIRLFLVYALLILAGIGISLRYVVDLAIGAPLSGPGVVVMVLLAYTIFTTTLVIQRKEASRGLALGLASLTLPLIPYLLLAGLIPQAGIVAVFATLLFRGLLRPEVRDDPLARGLLTTIPALEKVLLGHVRIRRQVAAVRAIEAIRAHLAASGGKLPASWGEVTVVPVPDDPLTGKPFAYALKDGKATITASPPEGADPIRSNNFRYELTVRPVK